MHWVGWRKVTKCKKDGGLGPQSNQDKNLALLAKLNWRFNTKRESVLARILDKKYCSPSRLASLNLDRLPCSCNWKALREDIDVYNEGT